ncbi:MAG: O-succinylhomoserine sulfhydrylase [Pseudomonadota bacterium]
MADPRNPTDPAAATLDALHPETVLVHAGTARSPFGETSEALFLTSGFVYQTAEEAEARFKGDDPGFVYSRYSNPTVQMLEERAAALEGADAARATASGMAAVAATMLSQLSAGDHVVAARALFGSCRYIVEELLPRFGITSTLVDGRDLDAWRSAVRDETRIFFFETPTNPNLELVDIAAVSEIAHAADAVVVIDNVFASPMLQRPILLGADIVVYSATKHIDGQGRTLGGLVLGRSEFITKTLAPFLKHTGPALSPFNAWVMLKGLETMPVRVARQVETAARVADVLVDHPGVSRLTYPGRADHPQRAIAKSQMSGGGTLISLDVAPGDGPAKARAFRMLNALRLIGISNNLGDAKSLVTHPATTTHQRLDDAARAELGISDATLRLSIGLERCDDLLADLTNALAHAGSTG